MALSVNEGKSLIKRGFRAIAYGGDLWLYQQTLREGLKAIAGAV
jgi:2-dehydro-3-deoxyglucarate aldolase/4-hydroxy-2-oxoheptanedioate aldolase